MQDMDGMDGMAGTLGERLVHLPAPAPALALAPSCYRGYPVHTRLGVPMVIVIRIGCRIRMQVDGC